VNNHIFKIFINIKEEEKMNIFTILLAIANAALAIAAFINIRQTRKIFQQSKTPLFKITESIIRKHSQHGVVTLLRVKIKNIGFGPAYNISLKCTQGNGEFECTPQVSGEGKYTPLTNIPIHLGVGEEGEWECKIKSEGINSKNALRDLELEITGYSMYNKRTILKFIWPADKILGIEETSLPYLVDRFIE
jgi:hypothetical protein